MKTRKTIRFALFVVMLIAIAFTTARLLWAKAGQNAGGSDESPTTAVATLEDLAISVTGSGTRVPLSETKLQFNESGRLLELLVDVGDSVQAGDLLALLQTSTTLIDLNQQITAAELEVMQAQIAYDQLIENADVAAAQALLNIESAEDALAEVLSQEGEIAAAMQAVAQAQQAIDDTETALYILNSTADEDAIYTAYASLLFKEKNLTEIEEEMATTDFKIRSADDERTRDMLRSRMLNLNSQHADAQLNYESALAKYESLFTEPDPVDITVAELRFETAKLQLAQAQADLDDLMAGPNAGDVIKAEANLASARRIYEQVKGGPDPAEVALAAAELQAAQARLAVLQSEKSVEELFAPVSGIVTGIAYEIDEYISGGTVLMIANVSQPAVEFSIDQADSADISVGDSAQVVFDALPDEVYTGTIVLIEPALHESNFVNTFQGLILLDDSSSALGLPIGLQASVEVIASEVVDAVFVPSQAVQTDSNGNTFVYRYEDESAETRQVSLGRLDGARVEILEGLSAGDVVAIDQFEILGNQ